MFEEGDAVIGKVAGLKIYAQPKKATKVVAALARGDEVIYTGKDAGDFMHVQGQGGEAWVERVMVRK